MYRINNIFCEDPYQKMWNIYVFFESEPTVKKYLLSRYTRLNDKEKNKLAFENTSKFIYFIKQAQGYFYSAKKSDILVKPLLVYYGMCSLIKAFILTKEPNYPDKVSVLRHGISTRKLKKTNFQFLEDEIKIQKDGLLPIFCNLISKTPVIDGTKFKIKELLFLIPELQDCLYNLYKERKIFKLHIKQLKETRYVELKLDKDVLSLFKNDKQILLDEINSHASSNNLFQLKDKNHHIGYISLVWEADINNPLLNENFLNHPYIIQDFKGNYYLRKLEDFRLFLPELVIEFLIMYNLGILCRYDTELWGEIVFSFSSEDMYIINEFINLTIRKFPNLILNELFEEYLIFKEN